MFRRQSKQSAAGETDEALLAQYASTGSLHDLGVLYARYMPMVYGVCLNILRDAQEAEDAVMAIFESLVAKARAHEIEHFRSWLYVLAKNHCYMELRKQNRRPTDLLEPMEMYRFDGVTAQGSGQEESDHLAALSDCISRLPPRQQRCVQLFYLEDKTYKQIAEALPEDLGKVRSHIQNGRRNLKICMEQKGIYSAAASGI